MTHAEAIEYLNGLANFGWKLGLDRMRDFVRAAGLDPMLSEPGYIQVAGTNGKGSTTANLQSLMIASGFRTGAYFSPYVYDPRERVQFGRALIPPDEHAQGITHLRGLAEEFVGISKFEMETALGLWHWQRRRAEWIALEVGLGGRLDATSVVWPRVGVIVSIGYDHINVLGDTLSQIAAEKAGIIKPGMPTMVGALEPEALASVVKQARLMEAPLWRLGHEIHLEGDSVRTPVSFDSGLVPGIVGARQRENMALAVAAWRCAQPDLPTEVIQAGVAAARIPGRFEVRPGMVLDGAHNGEAAQALRESLDTHFPEARISLLTGMTVGHDARRFYAPLRDRIVAATFVPIPFSRGRDPEELLNESGPWENAEVAPNLEAGLARAREFGDLVLVTGSFYLVGDLPPEQTHP